MVASHQLFFDHFQTRNGIRVTNQYKVNSAKLPISPNCIYVYLKINKRCLLLKKTVYLQKNVKKIIFKQILYLKCAE